MKTMVLWVLGIVAGCGGCIGAPFVLEETAPEPRVIVIETGPAEYPTGTVVVPAPTSADVAVADAGLAPDGEP